MIPLIQNSRKCKLTYSEREREGAIQWFLVGGEAKSRRVNYKDR